MAKKQSFRCVRLYRIRDDVPIQSICAPLLLGLFLFLLLYLCPCLKWTFRLLRAVVYLSQPQCPGAPPYIHENHHVALTRAWVTGPRDHRSWRLCSWKECVSETRLKHHTCRFISKCGFKIQLMCSCDFECFRHNYWQMIFCHVSKSEKRATTVECLNWTALMSHLASSVNGFCSPHRTSTGPVPSGS